jgi:hypothetical protein
VNFHDCFENSQLKFGRSKISTTHLQSMASLQARTTTSLHTSAEAHENVSMVALLTWDGFKPHHRVLLALTTRQNFQRTKFLTTKLLSIWSKMKATLTSFKQRSESRERNRIEQLYIGRVRPGLGLIYADVDGNKQVAGAYAILTCFSPNAPSGA